MNYIIYLVCAIGLTFAAIAVYEVHHKYRIRIDDQCNYEYMHLTLEEREAQIVNVLKAAKEIYNKREAKEVGYKTIDQILDMLFADKYKDDKDFQGTMLRLLICYCREHGKDYRKYLKRELASAEENQEDDIDDENM